MKKFSDINKINEGWDFEITNDVIMDLSREIWKVYPKLTIRTVDNRYNLYVENDQLLFETSMNKDGLEHMYTYLLGIITGMQMSGRKVANPGLRKYTKENPYGEEIW